MSKLRTLIEETVRAKNAGHFGIFTAADLALMLDERPSPTFIKFLAKAATNSSLERVARGLYINSVAPPNSTGVLEKIASLLHKRHFIYVSLETELSRIGVISQVPIRRLTMMTTGRSGEHKTKYGIIEFTHTKRSLDSLNEGVYYDIESRVFRATKEQAMIDLRRVGRNIHMIAEEPNDVT